MTHAMFLFVFLPGIQVSCAYPALEVQTARVLV